MFWVQEEKCLSPYLIEILLIIKGVFGKSILPSQFHANDRKTTGKVSCELIILFQ